jgi:surface polysaccharide O-acyltransferase-like enzyme
MWVITLLKRFFSEGTTLFVLVSGYLFYYLKGGYEYRTYLKRKCENVISPYVVVSIPAVMIYVFSLKSDHDWIDMSWFSSLPELLKVGYLYFTGAHLGPFWYIPVIAMVFASSPLTILLMKRVNPLLLFLICILISYFVPRPYGNSDVFMAYGHFYPLFVLGGVLCKCRANWISMLRNKIALFSLTSLYFVLLLSSVFGLSIPAYFDKIALFLIAYYLLFCFQNELRFGRAKKVLDFLAAYSFPIYFIHGYIVSSTKIAFSDFSLVGLTAYVAYSFAVFFIAIVSSILTVRIVASVFKERSNNIIGLNYKEYIRLTSVRN